MLFRSGYLEPDRYDDDEELEEALRESVQITAEREMVLAQEESARTNAERQVGRTHTLSDFIDTHTHTEGFKSSGTA